jgi:hypothetical protein
VGEHFPGQAGAALTQRTVGQRILLEELSEMFGQRAGGIHDMIDQRRKHLGQRDARPATAPLGQSGPQGAETLGKSGLKTGGDQRRDWMAAPRSVFFMPLFTPDGWTNMDLPSDFPKGISANW